jgi:hypothetical protein
MVRLIADGANALYGSCQAVANDLPHRHSQGPHETRRHYSSHFHRSAVTVQVATSTVLLLIIVGESSGVEAFPASSVGESANGPPVARFRRVVPLVSGGRRCTDRRGMAASAVVRAAANGAVGAAARPGTGKSSRPQKKGPLLLMSPQCHQWAGPWMALGRRRPATRALEIRGEDDLRTAVHSGVRIG